MFNGIIYKTGKVKKILRNNKSMIIGIESNLKIDKKDLGSSICCNGVCLTLTKINKKILFFYLSRETLKRSNFLYVTLNNVINLEKSIKHGELVSGHYSFGHIDCKAKIKKIIKKNGSWNIEFLLEKKYLVQLVEKGSITINGVSLTISKIYKKSFTIDVIPHTLKLTNLLFLKNNDFVNIEIDMISKYVSKYFN